jgi:phosphoserine phosphatase
MQLRNGKNTAKTIMNADIRATFNSVVNTDPVILFIREARSLLDELDEWDVNSARVAGLLEFYEYMNQHLPMLKDEPTLASFVRSVKKVVPNQMEELADIIRKNGDDMELLQTIDNLMHEMIRMIVIVN